MNEPSQVACVHGHEPRPHGTPCKPCARERTMRYRARNAADPGRAAARKQRDEELKPRYEEIRALVDAEVAAMRQRVRGAREGTYQYEPYTGRERKFAAYR